MRTWRVGTVSMGASLLLLGVLLLFSQFMEFDLVRVMTAWWPLLLIVLGIEILVYLFLSKQEKPILKYDFLSIIFVGILGTVGIAFAVLSTTGVMNKVEEVVAREERSFELPAFSQTIDGSIKRVVVKTVGYDLTVEATEDKNVAMFGTYRVQTTDNAKVLKSADDIVVANQKGDTLYLNFKMLPNEVSPFQTNGLVAATLLIPHDVQLEVVGNTDSLNLKPRMLATDWEIDSPSSITVDVPKNSNLKVDAAEVGSISGASDVWQTLEKTNSEDGEWYGSYKHAIYQSGAGTNHVTISNAADISLHTNQ